MTQVVVAKQETEGKRNKKRIITKTMIALFC